ncbi:MAG: hypothetical protein E7B49_07830 [Clostridium sp.]|nr:hypothetical protein [Clostridium sp.]
MPINTMDLLGVTFNEEIIGNMIVGLINNSNNFKNAFGKHILEVPNIDSFEVEAYTKNSISKGVPDIIVIAENANEIVISVIEEKLKANEGHNQTFVYTEEVAKTELIQGYNNDKKVKFQCIYLTLLEDELKEDDRYINKTFKDLINDVWVEIEDEGLNRLYKDFGANMIRYYSLKELPANTQSINILLDSNEKEKMFIHFRTLMLSLDYPDNLSVRFFGKGAGGDELSFISKLVKSRWIGKEAKWEYGLYEVGEETYEIHIEVEFHVTNEKLVLYVHYEPNPYITRYKLKNVANSKNVDAFEKRRNLVLEVVHNEIDKLGSPYIKKYEGTNSIAYTEFYFKQDTTIGDFKEVFMKYVYILSHIIDKSLDIVDDNRENIK